MITELVVSLGTAKKMKAAGWTKPTVFAWVCSDGHWIVEATKNIIKPPETHLIPACTAEEILVELPPHFIYKGIQYFIQLWKWRTDIWQICYRRCEENCVSIQHKSLSEAAAQMWLWCVDKGFIKTEDVKC